MYKGVIDFIQKACMLLGFALPGYATDTWAMFT